MLFKWHSCSSKNQGLQKKQILPGKRSSAKWLYNGGAHWVIADSCAPDGYRRADETNSNRLNCSVCLTDQARIQVPRKGNLPLGGGLHAISLYLQRAPACLPHSPRTRNCRTPGRWQPSDGLKHTQLAVMQFDWMSTLAAESLVAHKPED